jgi:hypothetical protein
MFKALVQLFTGKKPIPGASATPPWRPDPVNTIATEVAPGITATMSYQTGHHGFVQVVGESHYQETLQQLSQLFATIGRTERVFTVKLVPEPDNPYDPNAVAVVTEGDAKVGYLSRDVAKSYQKHLLQQPSVVTCPAKLVGGQGSKRSIGVVLDFESVQPLKTRSAR